MTRLKHITKITAATLTAAALTACGNADTAAPKDGLNQTAAEASATPKRTEASIAAIADMPPIELMQSATTQSNQLADVLAKVNDEASAETAIAQMRALGPQLTALGKRLDNIDENDLKLSIKTMKTVQAVAEAQMRIFNETGRIAKDYPELRDTIMEGFEDIEIDFQ